MDKKALKQKPPLRRHWTDEWTMIELAMVFIILPLIVFTLVNHGVSEGWDFLGEAWTHATADLKGDCQ